MFRKFTCLGSLLLSVFASVHADEPTVSYMFPAGGQRGTTVEFRVGGHYLHDRCVFRMHGEGVTAVDHLQRCDQTVWFEGPVIPLPDSQQKEDYPADHLGTVQITPDAAPGVRHWRVSTSQGVTAAMPFVVGDLPELVEQEIDGRPVPQFVELPVTINGRVFPREDIDVWSFDARASETITCDVNAARIQSPLDSRLKVVGPDGRVLTTSDDAFGKDSRVSFTARQDGRHEVHLWDADLGGLQHYIYRLTITRGPDTEAVYPLGGRRGAAAAFERIGRGIETASQELAIPADAAERILLPQSRSIWLETSDLEELKEQEPNNTPATANAAKTDAVLNGRIQSPGDADVWLLEATKDTPLDLDLRAARLNSLLDSVLTIRDADGRIVAESDDMAGGQADSRLRFHPPADGVFTVTITDRFSRRGDARFGYRLHVRPAAALPSSFGLTLPSDAANLKRGGEVKLKIVVDRQNGFAGTIQLLVDGLPLGVTVDEVTIPADKNETTLTLKAAADALVAVAPLTLRGRSETNGTVIEKTAVVPRPSPDEIASEQLWLAVTVSTPFKIVGDFETKYAPRGSTFVRHYRIDRGGYEGSLTVSLAERQTRHLQGVTGPVIEIPAGMNEFDYAVFLPPWMEIGRTSRTCLMAVGQVTTEDGRPHDVSYTSFEQNDQIIVLVDPARMNLRLDHSSLLAIPDTSVEMPVEVRRSPEVTGDIRIELIAPAHMKGVDCEPVDLPANSSRAVLRVQFGADSLGPFNLPVIIRATAMQDGAPCRAEAPLTLVAKASRPAQ